MIDLSNIKNLLTYNKKTGVFKWKNRDEASKSWNAKFADKKAGTINSNGYLVITYKGKKHFAHRLVLLYLFNLLPENQVDHINGERLDNRINNLRQATVQENNQNQSMHKNNSSGLSGVRYRADKGRWVATIKHKYRLIFLGYFDNFNDAATARMEAERNYGFHLNHGRIAA